MKLQRQSLHLLYSTAVQGSVSQFSQMEGQGAETATNVTC